MVVSLYCLDQQCTVCRSAMAREGYKIAFDGRWYSVVRLMDGLTVYPLHRGYGMALTHVEQIIEAGERDEA